MAVASSGDGATRPDTWFVALEVPDRVRTELVVRLGDLPSRTPDVAWTRSAGWHVTLAFLGRVDLGGDGATSSVDSVAAHLAGVVRPAVEAVPADRTVAGLGPTVVLGRAVALSLAGGTWLGDLHDGVDGCLRRAGVVAGPPARPFRPHLTVARYRSTTPAAAVTRVRRDLDVAVGEGIPLPVEAVAVMGSFHGDGPALHRVLARSRLPSVG